MLLLFLEYLRSNRLLLRGSTDRRQPLSYKQSEAELPRVDFGFTEHNVEQKWSMIQSRLVVPGD